jgi:hypothetical protein
MAALGFGGVSVAGSACWLRLDRQRRGGAWRKWWDRRDRDQRRLGGRPEQRRFGGRREQRRLNGQSEQRRLGGQSEQRRVGGQCGRASCGGRRRGWRQCSCPLHRRDHVRRSGAGAGRACGDRASHG